MKDFDRWCTRIRPGLLGLSSFVESLSLTDLSPSIVMPSPSWLHPPILSNATSHLQSFSALRALRIWSLHMSADHVSSMLHSSGSSLEDVTHLTLGYITTHPLALVMFIGHFPRLYDLTLSGIYPPSRPTGADDLDYWFDGDVVPSHPRGKFRVSDYSRYRVSKVVFEGITSNHGSTLSLSQVPDTARGGIIGLL